MTLWENITYTQRISLCIYQSIKTFKACKSWLVGIQKQFFCEWTRIPSYNDRTISECNHWFIVKPPDIILQDLFMPYMWDFSMIALIKGAIILIRLNYIIIHFQIGIVFMFKLCIICPWWYWMIYLNISAFHDTLNL